MVLRSFFQTFQIFQPKSAKSGDLNFSIDHFEDCQSLRLAGPHDPYVTYVTLTVSGGRDALKRRAFQYYESHGLKPQGVCKNRTGFWVWIQLIPALLHMSLQKDEKNRFEKMDHFVYKRTPDENCIWEVWFVVSNMFYFPLYMGCHPSH